MVNEAAKWGGRVDIICNYAGKVFVRLISDPNF